MFKMRVLIGGMLMFLTGGVFAENTVTVKSADTVTPVVELYTSEGCSSCPPADKALTLLGDNLDASLHAVLLGLHVDYWNYLGWPDPFSAKKYTARQYRLGAINSQRNIYTPEFFVAGTEVRGGGRNLVRHIQAANQQQAQVDIVAQLTKVDDKLQIAIDLDNRISEGNQDLFIAVYQNDIVRDIGAGENRGRQLTHDYVVRAFKNLGDIATGQSQRSIEITLQDDWNLEDAGVAVFVEQRDSGETLQAVSTLISRP